MLKGMSRIPNCNIFTAIKQGSLENVKQYIEDDPKMEIKDPNGKDPLYYALLSHNMPIIQCIIDKKLESNAYYRNVFDSISDCSDETDVMYIIKTKMDKFVLKPYVENKRIKKYISSYKKYPNVFSTFLCYESTEIGWVFELYDEKLDITNVKDPMLVINEISRCIYKNCLNPLAINSDNIFHIGIEEGELYKLGDCITNKSSLIEENSDCSLFLRCPPEYFFSENENFWWLNKYYSWCLGCLLFEMVSKKPFLEDKRNDFKTCGELKKFLLSEEFSNYSESKIDALECDEDTKKVMKGLLNNNSSERLDYTKINYPKEVKDKVDNINEGLRKFSLSYRKKFGHLTVINDNKKHEGNFGVVTKLRSESGKIYGLKREKMRSDRSDIYLEAIITEKNIHPSIVRTIGHSFQYEPCRWMVFIFIEGTPLSDYEMEDISSIKIYKILYGISSAFEEIVKDVAYCDLALRNIIIDRFGDPYIIDFGSSKKLSSIGRQESSNTPLRGSESSAAPEGTGNFKTYGKKYDVYAFGNNIINKFLPNLMKTSNCEVIQSLKKQCMDTDPDKRPSFQEIKNMIQEFVINDRELTYDDLLDFFSYKEYLDNNIIKY